MNLRLALAAATCLAMPAMAFAQPVTGPYVSLEAGTSILNPVGYSASLDPSAGKLQYRNDYAGVAALGYGLGDGFRFEVNVDDLHNTLHKTGAVRTSGTHTTFGPMVNALYDIPVGLPVFPYVGIGAGYQWVQANSLDNMAYSDTKASPAYDVVAGLSYPIDAVLPGLSVTGEYRFEQLVNNTKEVETIRGGYPAGSNTSGSIRFGQQSSNSFFLGLRYALFAAPAAAAPVPAPAPAPMAAAPAPTPARTFLVFFDWDKADLTARATQIISEAASDSKSENVTTLDVSGYTDTSGTATYNMGLSERRAKAVAGQLVADGVPAGDIEIHAFGETHLLVPTGAGVREPQNRRVEIVLN